MPRKYTVRALIGGNLANAEDWNEEISSAVSELNGQLDQNNMPLDSVDLTKVAPAVVVVDVNNAAVAEDLIAHTYMQSQSYHVSSSCIIDEVNNFYKDEWEPTDWQLGWMKLSEKRFVVIGPTTYYAGSELEFEAKEGMLVGEALVDCDWRTSYWSVTAIAPPNLSTARLRDKNFIELGVFVNDVCVGRTDLQWLGGRFTYVLPWSTPIGTTPVKIDIRFRLKFTNEPTPVTVNVTEDWIESFYLWDSSLFCRNQHR